MNFIYKKSFLKSFDDYINDIQKQIIKTDKDIRQYYSSRNASYGLRIKKLYDNGIEKTYEARVSDSLRIVWVEKRDNVFFACLGNHEEVNRYIRAFM